jgi:general secretion pathway protein D
MPLRPFPFTSFETRNTGVTLEIEPLIAPGGEMIELRLAPEIVSLLRMDVWVEHKDEWGEASLRMPTFETLRLSTATTLENGKFGLLGVLTPTDPKGGLMTERKLMLFVKADILTVEVPAKEKK